MTDRPPRPLPVVLLHSAGRSPQMWQDQVEAIGSQTQLVAPWLAGLRPGRSGELSLAAAAAEVISTMDRYGFERARLVGHQFGAMVALEAAASEPEMIAGLVLSGAALTPSRAGLTLQKTLVRLLPKSALAGSGATKADLLRALDVMASTNLGDRLDRITAPVLVVAGASDQTRTAGQQLAAALPHGDYVELAGAGASPNAEAPEEYNRLLLDFLARTAELRA
ncbi:MAG: alpha/beta fold hydrolase [Propionibacteriaceae bacterium]|nr:alpha/beta fold hydrolase [Propionibacteriaceae bacterium]